MVLHLGQVKELYFIEEVKVQKRVRKKSLQGLSYLEVFLWDPLSSLALRLSGAVSHPKYIFALFPVGVRLLGSVLLGLCEWSANIVVLWGILKIFLNGVFFKVFIEFMILLPFFCFSFLATRYVGS